MVSITGSVAAGRAVAVSAGGNLKRTHLELGGNSLIGTQLIGRLRQTFGVTVPLSMLFDAPTVSQMALAIESALIEDIDRMDEGEAVRLASS